LSKNELRYRSLQRHFLEQSTKGKYAKHY